MQKYGLLYSLVKKTFPGIISIEKKVKKWLGVLFLVFSVPFLLIGTYYASQYWPQHSILAVILLLIGAFFCIPGIILFILSFTTKKE
ncbi:MAG: hypothetical protein ACK4ND_08320 [Cytophagaceae bacterium]